ncbi:DsrE family protein [Thalassolituus sp.]|jgi:intracellular sulfur oxidation DsrE/DsrF family protein|uniref:DsrE family protein n=1 Tax=Thalassolituus sp. TaxID=2030822 RepID=UPI0035199CF5
MRHLLLAIPLLFPLSAFAEDDSVVAGPEVVEAVADGTTEAEAVPVTSEAAVIPVLFQARIQEHTADEMYTLLSRAERIAGGLDEYSTREPIAMVLHGDEIELFKRENYRDNKALIDLAARLDAFNIIDVKVCTTWMSQRGIELTDLPPFVDSVSTGDQEVKRLQKAGYAFF